MEQPSSSSKVTVEYFDPFNVYQLLSHGLLPRLPLRNLHWESHAGPLRSIDSLHVDLVPNSDIRPLSSASNTNLSRVKSNDTTDGDDGFRVQSLGANNKEQEKGEVRSGTPAGKPSKSRRHQIPGLRQTPYLKIFLLRCDDNEAYKGQARKQVRDWIKEHTSPSQSTTKASAQENHDAFEWLIVHVIVPNTAAASQPRISTKGSSTIWEKLRADFNGASKGPDRVAQIRIGINDVSYDLLPRVVPAIPGSYTETPQEHQEAWVDLVDKLKSLILASFDMRVRQYEDDIKEKDAQRALPGWNFCTFFVLKEGLARGFESVGLIEDSLVGYDELAVGLDAIIREQATTGSEAEHGGSFLPFTQDLKISLDRSISLIREAKGIHSEDFYEAIDMQTSKDGQSDQDEIPINASRKSYRELILANDISIFDFRSYLFARQLSLLLRFGNAWSSREELLAKLKEQRESSLQGVAPRNLPSQTSEDDENLEVLGEICKRAMAFIVSISQIMREDLLKSIKAKASQNGEITETENSFEDPVILQAINNAVASFTFSIAQQILAQTSTKALPIPPSTLAPPSDPGQEQKAAIPEPKTMMHPARSTSLLIRSAPNDGPPSPNIFPGRRSSVPDQSSLGKPSTFLKSGLETLAARRAELYLLSRRVVEQLGTEQGWLVGWHVISETTAIDSQMENVSLDDEDAPKAALQRSATPPSLHGITSKLLHAALTSQGDFYRLYETLTDKALRHYTVASHTQSMQATMSDLAILKYHLKDYAAAASYFYRMTPFYGENGWEQIEISMLTLYSKCLKELRRNDDYVRVALKLLGKTAMAEKERMAKKSEFKFGRSKNAEESLNIGVLQGHIEELMAAIPNLPSEITAPMQSFFSSVEIDGTFRYHDEKDSFALVLKLHYLFTDELKIDTAKVRMVPAVEGQGRDIWLESDEPFVVENGTMKVQLQSNVMIPGKYIVKQVILRASKMVISYDADNAAHAHSSKFLRSPILLLYQRPRSVSLNLSASRYMHLSRTRTLEISISSGWGAIESGQLHVRAGTGGLRLQTGEVTVLKGDLKISKKSDPGIIHFKELAEDTTAVLCLPFNVETEVPEIFLKLELSYSAHGDKFFFACQPKMNILLPLGVNVQDVFKHRSLFSKFSVTSATTSPLKILDSVLRDSELFHVSNGSTVSNAITVFPKQPASLLYKVTRKEGVATPATVPSNRVQKDRTTLALTIHYLCIEEEIDLAITKSLESSLVDSPFFNYSKVVIPLVLQQVQTRTTPYDLERTVLLNEISTGILKDVRWHEKFQGLGRDESGREIASLLSKWLQDWQSSEANIQLLPIVMDAKSILGARSVIIPVEIPSVTVTCTADLQISRSQASKQHDILATTNEPLSAILKIKWTHLWDTRPSSTKDADHEFVYELSAPSELWLLGGKRKGHFTIPASRNAATTTFRFPILMIPIREGLLPYPSLEIKPAGQSRSALKNENPNLRTAGQLEVTCETDYKNVGEAIRVVNGAWKTTVSLDASGPQGGAWLLESEQRKI